MFIKHLVVGLVGLSLVGVAEAADIWVSPNGSQGSPGNSIQQAIDQAQPGDTIRLTDGIFYQNRIEVPGNITIQGSSSTVLRPYYYSAPDNQWVSETAFLIGATPGQQQNQQQENIIISNIYFQGLGRQADWDNTAPPYLNVEALQGGAIEINILNYDDSCGNQCEGTINIKDCVFSSMSSTQQGGAIYVWGDVFTPGINVSGCTFFTCSSMTGGAIYVSGCQTDVDECWFIDCKADFISGSYNGRTSGGAIAFRDTPGKFGNGVAHRPCNIEDSCFIGNYALSFGSDFYAEHAGFYIDDCFMSGAIGGQPAITSSILIAGRKEATGSQRIYDTRIENSMGTGVEMQDSNIGQLYDARPWFKRSVVVGNANYGLYSREGAKPYIYKGFMCWNGDSYDDQVEGGYDDAFWWFDDPCIRTNCSWYGGQAQNPCGGLVMGGLSGTTELPGHLLNTDFQLGIDGLAGWRSFNNAFGHQPGDEEWRTEYMPASWNSSMKAFGNFSGSENYSGVSRDLCWEPGSDISFGVDYFVAQHDKFRSSESTVGYIDIGGEPAPILIEPDSSNTAYAALNIWHVNEEGDEVIWYVVPTPQVSYSSPVGTEGQLINNFIIPPEQADEITRVEFVLVFRQLDNYDTGSIFFRNAFANGLPCDPLCTGDLDGDYSVGIEDMLMVIDDWGAECQGGFCIGDADLSDFVDIEDLLTVVENWGCTTPNP